MKHRKKLLMGCCHALMLLLFLVLFCAALGHLNPGPSIQQVETLSSVRLQVGTKQPQRAQLPLILSDLPARTPVTVTAVIYPDADDEVYVKTSHCPADVYLNNILQYEFGTNNPSFLADPAVEVHMIKTQGQGSAMELQIRYLSPAGKSFMLLEPPLLGNTKEIILERFHACGMPWILALAQILYGISLLFIAVCIQFLDRKGMSFLWLGLFAISSGAWALGESHFSILICKNSAALYVLSFSGFLIFAIPLLRFARSIVNYRDPRSLWYLELMLAAAAASALLLQLLGLVPCTVSMGFFAYLLPCCLLYVTVCTVREYLIWKSPSAGRFILPVSILTVSLTAGLFLHFSSHSYLGPLVTQVGILIFLLIMGITAGLSVKDHIYLQNQEKQLQFERSLMEIQAKEQKTHSDLLNQQALLLSQQRHDLRHHLHVIKGLAREEDTELNQYLDNLMESIPQPSRRFCENQAVNAIVSHYHSICRQKAISFTAELVIPEHNPHISDNTLCVIFGNLLENAVEACDRMETGEKFIKLRSTLQYELLAVTMDNSFSGILLQEGEQFRSLKRDAYGIGLASIRSAARKSGGSASFCGKDQVFYSSVFLNL